MAPIAFSYHRALAPMLWVMIGLGTIELLLGHFLIALWNSTVALILSLLTIATLIWLVMLIRSFKRLPVLLDDETILFRTGTLNETRVPIADVASVERHFAGEALKHKGVLNFGMMSYPNLLIGLATPIEKRRQTVSHIAFCFDEPDRFAAALAAARAAAQPTADA